MDYYFPYKSISLIKQIGGGEEQDPLAKVFLHFQITFYLVKKTFKTFLINSPEVLLIDTFKYIYVD